MRARPGGVDLGLVVEALSRPVVVGAAIVRGGRLLAQQRAYPDHLAGQWELPGGRVEPGETEVDALVRECVEELGVQVRVGGRVGPDVPLPEAGAILRVYAATLVQDGIDPIPREHRTVRWVAKEEVAALDWLRPDRLLVPHLRDLLS
ncbi:(deoxy)nucleoside triphosphate pyrophosphohydrolase [Thermasporomyces composti]|uniref:8-oxo-dGTP diphosphatase n=1 Tax=Thermasporomyces composti TaxID=696763 RepID=A0A3D9VFL6_THECX|nr:NUDIX domain-containing protein [Thermasporomyces composti]REF36944.1 8-oxo-dGTP diphosphatase [Thermasporomyces composti]